MPLKAKQSSLGRALIKERFGGKQHTSGKSASSQHMREYAQIADTAALNLKSVTELSSLDEFLETAQLAGTEFVAERMNVEYVQASTQGITSAKEIELITQAQNEFRSRISIPRRPKWTETTSAADLEKAERESFLEWRRNLSDIQEQEHIMLTPYEKNLDFWRQLWRVIERSDLIVQIVDARDPLLYRCEDLESYVKDIDSKKQTMILINKADLLSQKQRECWASYFKSINIIAVFWSATLEAERLQNLESGLENVPIKKSPKTDLSSTLLSKDELINFFKLRLTGVEGVRTVGMVGYPNVGKSSTINTILQSKKVAVSATPGRTKHFQTFFIDEELVLCDCPGLVFPSFVTNKAEMILSGILSIDEMRDHIPPVNLVCHKIPRQVLEATYGINIAKPKDGEDEFRPPTSPELLDAYGLMRGFMTSRGQPDNPRSARILLKDYVKGKILYCKAPPDSDQDKYSSWNFSIIQHLLEGTEEMQSEMTEDFNDEIVSAQQKVEKMRKKLDILPTHEVDDTFFNAQNVQAFTKGTLLGSNQGSETAAKDQAKSWKRHNNKNKKEKMRRTRDPKLIY